MRGRRNAETPWRELPPTLAAGLLAAGLLLASCGSEAAGARLAAAVKAPAAAAETQAAAPLAVAAETPQPPAGPGALAPHLAAGADGSILLSWLEPDGAGGHRLRLARFAGGAWGEAATVAAGDDVAANWANTPSIVEDGTGGLWAQWLTRVEGGGHHDAAVHHARSTDGGATWRPLGLLHDDDSAAEHGFATLLPAAGGGGEAIWLDGRARPGGGDTALLVRRLGAAAAGEADGASGEPRGGGRSPEATIDPRVCDCCSTAAARTADGLLVAYRDRSAEEVRDVALARRGADGAWSEPVPLHRDGWAIPGCPVNGPVIDAHGRGVAAAWFTAAGGGPRVLAARSADAGATWSEPTVVDAEAPLGRVGLALLPDGSAVVSWLAADGAVRLRRLAADGSLGAPTLLAVSAASRAAGVPRLVAAGDRLAAAWVEPGPEETPATLRFAAFPATAIP
jgi:hypothetical protein